MIDFKINDKPFTCPTHLSECTAEQVAQIMAFQLSKEMFGTDLEKIKVKLYLWHKLTGVSESVVKKMTVRQKERILSMIYWCQAARVEKRPFEHFEIEKTKFYLPKEAFEDTTVYEMAMCNIELAKLVNYNIEDSLYTIIAYLCRPLRVDIEMWKLDIDYNGDHRVPFNEALGNERANGFKGKLSAGIAKAVLDYFVKMNTEFWDQYSDVLDGDDEDEQATKTEARYKNGEGQITVLFQIAEMKVYGDFDKVCRKTPHTIYTYLRDKKLQVQEEETRQKLNQNPE